MNKGIKNNEIIIKPHHLARLLIPGFKCTLVQKYGFLPQIEKISACRKGQYFKNYYLELFFEHEREEKDYKRDGNPNFEARKDDANHMDQFPKFCT